MERVVKDGKVAVCYSPGYGAGWSSWADDELKEALMFHPAIVNMILEGKEDLIDEQWLVDNLGEEYENVYTGGLKNLTIEWIPQGSLVRINEYDGYESVEIYDTDNYFIA
jgi:hypothetical protein